MRDYYRSQFHKIFAKLISSSKIRTHPSAHPSTNTYIILNVANLFQENVQHHDEAWQDQFRLSVIQVIWVRDPWQFLRTYGGDGLPPLLCSWRRDWLGLSLQIGCFLRVRLDPLHAQLEDAQQKVHRDDDVKTGQNLWEGRQHVVSKHTNTRTQTERQTDRHTHTHTVSRMDEICRKLAHSKTTYANIKLRTDRISRQQVSAQKANTHKHSNTHTNTPQTPHCQQKVKHCWWGEGR